MRNKKLISLSVISIFALSVFSGAFLSKNNVASTKAAYTPPFTTYANHDGDTYYAGIDDSLTGNDLLQALRSLNNKRKKANGGYKPLLKGNKLARYTDFDPNDYELDVNNQPYSDTILSFYSGNKSAGGSGMNREHVWPDSRGGNYVEADTHMARPTLNAENGARGNSFYVEGMKSTKSGWDPAMESFGDETYRGDAARIIFYCAMSNSSLSLIDETNDSESNNTMGKLSDLLKWNLNYDPLVRETNRNEGVQYIQGNRNPFIDHPEYACRIWGDYNDMTRTICSGIVSLTGITLSGQTTLYNVNDEFSFDGTCTATYSNGTSKVVTPTSVSTPDMTVTGNQTVTVTYTEDEISKSATYTIKVVSADYYELTGITVSGQTTSYNVGDEFSFDGTCTATYSNKSTATVTPTSVTNPNMNTSGTKTIYVSYSEGGITKSTSYLIYVKGTDIPVLSSIDVDGQTMEYNVGDVFEFDGVVTAHYSDGSSQEVEPTTVSTPNLSKTGTKIVTVTYTEDGITKQFSYMITVTQGVARLVSIAANNYKTKVTQGSIYSFDGVVTATYSDGLTAVVTPTSISEVDTSELGEKEVIISYTEGSITVETIIVITVVKKSAPKSSGCGGNIATTSVLISALSILIIGILLIKRKTYDKEK